jgi:hypothetical protein
MSTSLIESDLNDLTDGNLDTFDREVCAIPPDACASFLQAASRLEAELLSIYRMVALSTKREESLDRVGRWWKAMVEVCDRHAGKLKAISESHPNCGADFFYDRIFDLRNKCLRLQSLHE